MRYNLVLGIIFSFSTGFSQSYISNINADSFTNYADSYNYTYWNDSWKSAIAQNRSFSTMTTIYTVTGQRVKKIDTNSTSFNVESLPVGLYFVEFILEGNRRITRTFQKK